MSKGNFANGEEEQGKLNYLGKVRLDKMLISSTFYSSLFCAKVLFAAFL